MPYLNAGDFAKVRAAMVPFEDDEALDEAKALMDAAADAVASPGLRELAHELHGTDECEIDDEGAGTSEADEGIWVQAWVWVPHDELVEHGLREDEEDDDAPSE